MSEPPSRQRRSLLAGVVLLVPLVVDPFGADTLTAKHVLLAVTGLLLAVGECFDVLARREGWLRPRPVELLLLVLALWTWASLLWAPTPSLGLPAAAAALALPALARAVRSQAQDDDQRRAWVVALVRVGLVAALVDSAAILLTRADLSEAERKYASWLFTHNNLAAAYVVPLVPLAMGLALSGRPRAPWALAVLGLVAYLGVLGSRAGLAAAALGIVLVPLLTWGARRLRAPNRRDLAALGVLAAAGLALPFWDGARGAAKWGFYQFVGSLEQLGLGSLNESLFRPILWRRAIDLAAEHPWGGVGAGQFMVAYSRFDHGLADKPHAHNDALQLLVELGLPGLALFLLGGVLVALALWTALARRAASGAPRTFPAALAGALFVFAVDGLFEVPFALGASASVFAVLVGLVGSLESDSERAAAGRARGVAVVLGSLGVLGLLAVARHVPASAWHAQATARWVAGDLAGARQRLQWLADLHLGGHLPHRLLGQLAWNAGDWEGAAGHYRRARQLWPYGVDIMVREGEALLRLGRADEALVVFREALVARPADADAIGGLLRSLERSGQVEEAIARAEFLVQVGQGESLDLMAALARLWAQSARSPVAPPERIRALVAARHFYAVLLEDGDPRLWPSWSQEFKHLTHLLQQEPGAPDAWWQAYEEFRTRGGWRRPAPSLWTSFDGDGVRLFPGWEDSAGPPLPRAWR